MACCTDLSSALKYVLLFCASSDNAFAYLAAEYDKSSISLLAAVSYSRLLNVLPFILYEVRVSSTNFQTLYDYY